MLELFGLIRRLAPHVRTVLLTGERAPARSSSPRRCTGRARCRSGRFVTVNCSAVVVDALRKRAFRSHAGAFTGATDHNPALSSSRMAARSFLDEIGELPSSVQAKLLRVLELGEVHRVGSSKPGRSAFHVIAATKPRSQG